MTKHYWIVSEIDGKTYDSYAVQRADGSMLHIFLGFKHKNTYYSGDFNISATHGYSSITDFKKFLKMRSENKFKMALLEKRKIHGKN